MDFCARKKEHTEKKEWKGIVRSPTHSHPFLKGGELNFDYFPRRGGEGGGGWGGGGVFVGGGGGGGGGGGWHFTCLIFSRFIIFTFKNYFILCKIMLCILIKNYFLLSP